MIWKLMLVYLEEERMGENLFALDGGMCVVWTR